MFKTIEDQIKYWNGQMPALVGPLPSHVIGKAFRDLHPEPLGRVLDFGCGVGRIYRGLKPLDYYVGLDISESYLNIFRVSNPEVFLIQVEDFKIPLLKDDFDTVTCYSVFTHLHPEHMDLILNEFHRVLKPGGKVLVSIFELEVVGIQKLHNWTMIERQKFLDLCGKHHFKIIGEVKVPARDTFYQTLFMLENRR